jgi:cystathionine beta-synthase
MTLMHGARANITEAIGNTPIVRLNKVAAHVKSSIYVKCEYLNPGGSVKDRIAVHIIRDAERRGLLAPGGTIIEATSGNTGAGLAMVAALRGYRTIFVMPDKMSQEKVANLRALGAKVVLCPTAVDASDPRSYYEVTKRLVAETPGAFHANQYHNPANPEAHYLSTGPEIWEQTQGGFDVFVSGMGTGGTISGCGRYFKEQNPKVHVVGVDPIGSIYYELKKTGRMTRPFAYSVEGIGEDFLPSTMNLDYVDEIVRVDDKECFQLTRALVRQEGVMCGGSCGAAVAGAIRYAEQLDRDGHAPQNILVLLPDGSQKYLSKIFDDNWMRDQRLPRHRRSRWARLATSSPPERRDRSSRRSEGCDAAPGHLRCSKSTASRRCRWSTRSTVGSAASIAEVDLLNHIAGQGRAPSNRDHRADRRSRLRRR